MDFLRRIVGWIRGVDVINDSEREITNGTPAETLELPNSNAPAERSLERTCDCSERVRVLEEAVDRLTSNVISLLQRTDRNDHDIDDIMRRFSNIEYSPNYVPEEQETIPEYLVPAGTSQQNRIESPAGPDQEVAVEQNQNQALNNQESTSEPVQPNQEVLRITPQHDTNRRINNVTVAQCYKMDYKNRGLCLLFTHELFKNERLTKRPSATKEARMIETTFNKLGYRVKVCRDYNFNKIKKQLSKLEDLVYPDDDCISICISTHGYEDILWACDCAYPIDIFENALSRMKKLMGKPKKIFIQACRGKKIDRGIGLSHTDSQSDDETDNFVDSKKHPSRADFLIVHSTPYGYVSWRNWFFVAFCHMLDRYSEKDDIDEILRKTARKICEYESRCDNDASRARAKQVPTVYSTLLKKLYLKRK